MQQFEEKLDSSFYSIPTLRLSPGILKPLFLFLFSCGIFYLGIKVVLSGNMDGFYLLAVFGLASIASLIAIIPGCNSLEINLYGITVTSCFRQKTYQWEQIDRIGIYELGMIRRVGVDLNKRYQGPERVPDFAKPASGYHISLPPMAGMDIEALLETIERCRDTCFRNNFSCL